MATNLATWHRQRTEQKVAQSVGKQEQQADGRQHEGSEQRCRAELHSPEPRMMEAAAAAAEGARTKNACPSHFHASEATMNCIGSSAHTKVVSHAQLQTRAQRYEMGGPVTHAKHPATGRGDQGWSFGGRRWTARPLELFSAPTRGIHMMEVSRGASLYRDIRSRAEATPLLPREEGGTSRPLLPRGEGMGPWLSAGLQRPARVFGPDDPPWSAGARAQRGAPNPRD